MGGCWKLRVNKASSNQKPHSTDISSPSSFLAVEKHYFWQSKSEYIGEFRSHPIVIITFSTVPVMGATAPPCSAPELTADKYLGTGRPIWALPSCKKKIQDRWLNNTRYQHQGMGWQRERTAPASDKAVSSEGGRAWSQGCPGTVMVTALPVPEAWEVTRAAGRTSKEGTTPGTKQLHVDLCTNPVFVPSLFLQQQCRRLWECIKVFAQGQEVLHHQETRWHLQCQPLTMNPSQFTMKLIQC